MTLPLEQTNRRVKLEVQGTESPPTRLKEVGSSLFTRKLPRLARSLVLLQMPCDEQTAPTRIPATDGNC
jgi:hypothetical protein